MQLAAGAEMLAAVEPPGAAAAVQQLLSQGLSLGRPSHEECVEVHATLQVGGGRAARRPAGRLAGSRSSLQAQRVQEAGGGWL
jgi:hypothetical protein